MMRRKIGGMLAAGVVLAALASPAAAARLRFANDGDVPTLDFMARGESFALGFMLNIYEPLVRRDRELKLEPALATEWSQSGPLTWRFKLRPGVKFHDGTPFGADDVVFSFQRAAHPLSELRPYIATVKEVRKLDPLTVEMEATGPDPVFVDKLHVVGIMSKAWAEAHNAAQPVDLSKNEESYANRNANGTGPFVLKAREPGIRTVLAANPAWWDKPQHNLEEIELVRIANAATRVAALLSGEVDMVYSVPTQDIERIGRTPELKILQTPDLRTIFLAMDQARDELLESNIKGRNPFKDRRVREAVSRAIDIQAIQSRIMRGQSLPIGLMWGPNVSGYNEALDRRPAHDPEAARRLLAEAGYPNGFEVGLDCPNDRFTNDEATCQAIVAMLARVGIKVNLAAVTRSRWFSKILGPGYNSSFAIVGWAAQTTYDAGNVIENVLQSRNAERKKGMFNIGGYSNPALDALADRIEREVDPKARQGMIDEVIRLHQADIGHVPLHQLVVIWAARRNVEMVQSADNMMRLMYARVN